VQHLFLNFSCMLLETADYSCHTSACCVMVQVTHLASTDNDGERKYVQHMAKALSYGKSIVMGNGVVGVLDLAISLDQALCIQCCWVVAV